MMDVIVAGGGPVGMMTAALLHAAGVTVEVYERDCEINPQSRATTLHPRTLEVLTMLDHGQRRISDVLVAEGIQVPHAHFAMLPQQLDYRDLDTPYPYLLTIPQWRTEQLLAEHLHAHAIAVHRGAEVTEVEQSADEVRIRVGETWRTARYLVGADGAHSLTRKATGIDFVGTTPNVAVFAADVHLTEPMSSSQFFWSPVAGHAATVPLPGGIYRVFGAEIADAGLTAEQVRRRQAEQFTLADLREALIRICGRDFGVHNPVWLSRSSNSGRHAEHFREGRIMLAGDAAHVHLPAGGQGLNVGLQDATNLAWKLAAEVNGWAPERLVGGEAGYDRERRPVAQRLVANTLAQDALMHTFSDAGAALREMVGGLIARHGEVSGELSGWLSGLAISYQRPDAAHPLVGTKAPDIPLAEGNLLRALRPDRFLLLDLSGDLPHVVSARVDVTVVTRRPTGWDGVAVALIRPDGHVAYAAEGYDGLSEAISAWTEPRHQPAHLGEL